ncbi:hypothetical protein ACQWHU_26235, partial [Salmonella enterica subsp. enterica serovar Infantis]
ALVCPKNNSKPRFLKDINQKRKVKNPPKNQVKQNSHEKKFVYKKKKKRKNQNPKSSRTEEKLPIDAYSDGRRSCHP